MVDSINNPVESIKRAFIPNFFEKKNGDFEPRELMKITTHEMDALMLNPVRGIPDMYDDLLRVWPITSKPCYEVLGEFE